jgi:hypothetical protein
VLAARDFFFRFLTILLVLLMHQWLDETVTGPDLVCLVIFRGSWCKYDKHYLQKLGEYHISTMKKENVQIIAWTSEGAEGAARADTEWRLTKDFGYTAVLGDETNVLANWLKEDELLPDLVIATPEEAQVTNLLPEGSNYPNGIVMPGMIWYAHHGSPVFEWTKTMEAPGYGGPGRPDPVALWETVLKRKHALDSGNAVMPSHGTQMKMCSTDLDIAMSNCEVS